MVIPVVINNACPTIYRMCGNVSQQVFLGESPLTIVPLFYLRKK